MNHTTEFSQQLRKLRKASGLTQEELAAQLHISVTHEGKLESGSRAPSLELLLQISDHFGVSLDRLMKGQSGPSPEAKEAIRQAIRELKRLEKLLF